MRLLLYFFRAYPLRGGIMLLALLFAGIAEGAGLSALLPLLNIAINKNAAGSNASGSENEFSQAVTEFLNRFGIEPDIGTLLIIIVIGVTIKSLLLLVAKKQVGYTAAQITTDMRLELLSVVLRSKWEYFVHQPIGKFTNSLATEAARTSEAFVNGATVITFLIQAFIYGFVAIAVSWKATLISLVAGAVIIGLSHFLVRMARKAGKKQTALYTSLLSRLTDTLQSVKPLKAMGREHLVDSVLSMETSKMNRALQKQVYSKAVLGAAQEEMFAIVMALGMFIALVKFGMPFSTVMVLVVVLGRMLSQFGKVQKQYQKMAISESAFWSMKRTIREAREAEETLGEGISPTLEQGIKLDHVDFAYTERKILDQLSLDIPAGSLTTLIGASGSGKTTVIDLVIGLLQPQAGSILIDGQPSARLDTKAWRRMIGYVPQETLLLHDSIAHNVTLGDPALGDADAAAALRAAGAWEFVQKLPEGLASTVGERGNKLSGGQRQRVIIARALVNKPKLLILDEATSALDPASELEIRKTVESLHGKLTILAISHQTHMVEAADRVYRLENGQATVVENTS